LGIAGVTRTWRTNVPNPSILLPIQRAAA